MDPINVRPKPDRVDLDEAVRKLGDRPSRRVLTGLLRDSPRYQGEFESAECQARDSDWETVRTEFSHIQLPSLEQSMLIDWDRDTGKIRRGKNFDEIRPLLKLLEDYREDIHEEFM